MSRALLILLAAAFCGSLRAHTVPVVVIEAEFSGAREAVIKVNLDPRLFLTAQPAAVPPVPASWWFEQDEPAQQDTRKAAADYVARTFTFSIGSTTLQGDWKVEPIDSASAFPLGQASTEAHLLVEHRGALPASTGDFKVAVGKECAVAVILLCSNTGDAERRPQSLFPGEISRAFPLPAPALPAPDATKPTEANDASANWQARLAWVGGSVWNGHFIGDHLALAAALGFAWWRRWWRAAGVLAGFHVVDALAACAVAAGWLPTAPPWMMMAYWAALGLTAMHVFALKSKDSNVLFTLVVAGLCHGLNTPHLHVQAEAGNAVPVTAICARAGMLLLLELVVLAACAWLAWLVRRGKTQAPCTTVA
jgi:hypothetical protein